MKIQHLKFKLAAIIFCFFTTQLIAQTPFKWGVASASYQVEGAYKADGKGLCNWDVYTNTYQITKAFTGVQYTGNIALNHYDRNQYLQDFALMKKLGVNCYRFSISWARLLPNGTGIVNKKGVQHYHQFIDDMLAMGIEPCVTLFHWDMPQALQQKGAFNNFNFVKWYEEYSNLVFKEYGKKVKLFITFNEPTIDLFLFENWASNVINKKKNPFEITTQEFTNKAVSAHHLMLASATAIKNYHKLNLDGKIGITLNLFPCIPKDENNAKDVAAATVIDGVYNQFFLDGSLKGTYPKEVVDLYKKHNKNFIIKDAEMQLLKENPSDFMGVNFYAPNYVSYDEHFALNANWMTNNPDSVKMFNGPVRPEYFYKLLMRIKNDYNNPIIYVTENGAGFGSKDDTLVNETVNDVLRIDYLKKHIDAMLKAKQDGANVQGYMLWSILDNFEWSFGYKSRFGLVYVDFKTQKRTPKNSFYEYQKIIEKNK